MKPSNPRRVLYIDGEMPLAEIQRRLREICKESGVIPDPENLVLLTADSNPAGLPDLSTPEGQALFQPYLDGFDLIIIDNLSTLCRTGVENEAESWGAMQTWLIRQRNAGRSVMVIHHAGKNGAQRGTSRREDVMDTVIQLRRPAGYDAAEGARFELVFTKARHFFGPDAEPIEVHRKPDGSWEWQRLKEAKRDEIVDRYKNGETQRDIAIALNVSQSSVSKALAAAGIVCSRGRRKVASSK